MMANAALDQAKQQIDAIVTGYQQAAQAPAVSVVGSVTAGAVYEAWVLCR
jgi:hypothetical protein